MSLLSSHWETRGHRRCRSAGRHARVSNSARIHVQFVSTARLVVLCHAALCCGWALLDFSNFSAGQLYGIPPSARGAHSCCIPPPSSGTWVPWGVPLHRYLQTMGRGSLSTAGSLGKDTCCSNSSAGAEAAFTPDRRQAPAFKSPINRPLHFLACSKPSSRPCHCVSAAYHGLVAMLLLGLLIRQTRQSAVRCDRSGPPLPPSRRSGFIRSLSLVSDCRS